MDYQETIADGALKWPYPIKYHKVNRVEVDVLVAGASFAGCSAGIAAARRGAKVAVVDKAPIKRSGCGGVGMDHWNGVFSNPKSPMTPEEVCEQAQGWRGLLQREYIAAKGCWDALLELERLGLPIRDEDDDFLGMPTRDEDSKLLKAYDYTNIVSIKLRGGNYIKPILYNGLCKEPNASLYDRVMITSLLTESGKQGARVVGATGFSLETGEFYVFNAKSVIIASGYVCSCWIYNLDITGNSYRWDPNDIGEGLAMAWNAGAQVYGMHKNGVTTGNTPFAWPRFGTGCAGNTWFPCAIVDNNGKVIPWEDADGHIIETVQERNIPKEGTAFYGGGLYWKKIGGKTTKQPNLIHDLGERIRKGEYELPLWADLAGMPEEERHSIWGMMIGNEGKTRYTLYDLFTRSGFNPDKDMLMVPFMAPESYMQAGVAWFMGENNIVKPWRSERGGQGEIASDWNLMTTTPGLYVAGAAGGLEGCSFACSSGFYAGNRAAENTQHVTLGQIDENQLNAERERVYAPVKRSKDPTAYVSWKELWGGSTRVMQQCCADNKTIPTLKFGLLWMDSIKKTEMQQTYARNPHELARVLEGETRIACSEVFLQACIAKIEAEEKGISEDTFIFNQLVGEKVVTSYQEDKYWLKPPYASTYLENYNERRSAEPKTIREAM